MNSLYIHLDYLVYFCECCAANLAKKLPLFRTDPHRSWGMTMRPQRSRRTKFTKELFEHVWKWMVPPFQHFSTPCWCKFISKLCRPHPMRFYHFFVFRRTSELLGAFASVPRLCPACCGLWHRQWTHHRWLICDLPVGCASWCNLWHQIVTYCDTMSHHVAQIVTKCHQGIWSIASEFMNQPLTLQLFRFFATASTERYNQWMGQKNICPLV